MLLRHGALARADLVEQRLQVVREFRDAVEAERATATLDGMGGAEDLVDRLAVEAVEVQHEQGRLHGVEPFEALLEEHLVQRGHVQ